MKSDSSNEFENLAGSQGSSNILTEFIQFLAHNKKWWLAPILIVLLMFGALIFMSGTAAAPFIYTLF